MALRSHSHILIYNSINKVQSYWDAFKPQHPTGDNDYIDKWLANTKAFDAISFQSHVCITLWDVVSNRFIFAADKTNALGDTVEYLLDESGVDYSVSKFHPDHLEAVLTFQKRGMEFCIEHRELLPNNISLNLDTLYDKNGSYIQILQQGVPVETDHNGHPLLFLSFIYDISHLKKYNTASFAITTPETTFLYNYSFETKKTEEVKPFTSSEKAILKMLGEGKSTKQIASELSVSPFTIDTHRGNMLGKTNCVDTTALVTYCRRVGIL